MEDIKIWFEPLLWIMGTIGAIAAFVRFCRPVWNFFQYPIKSEEHFKIIDEKLDRDFELLTANEVINKKQESVQLSLLHDAIIQIYNNAKNNGDKVHTAEYQRAQLLYQENGQSPYIDSVMEELSRMWKEGQRNETNS